jgi:hypothetical protein
MIRYAKKSRIRRLIQMTVLALLVAIGSIGRLLIHDDPWQFSVMSVAALAFSIIKLCEIGVPPTILFLSTSSPLSVKTMARLNLALPYCRVVSLLDPRERLPYEEVKSFFQNDLRTTNVYEWRSIVFHLMDVVPIIVIDAQSSMAGVREELQRLEQRGYLNRTAYVVDDESPPPPSDRWERVARETLPFWVGYRLQLQHDQTERLARQAQFDAMLAAVPAAVRDPQRFEAMVVKARYIQNAEVRRFIRVCKGADPDEAGDCLLENIPSQVTRDEEVRFLRESRALEEVEILLRSAMEEVECKADANQQFNIANSYNSLGVLARLRCDWPEAERLIEEAVRRLQPLLTTSTQRKSASQELATAFYNLGEVSMARYRETQVQTDLHRAEDYFLKSIEVDRQVGGDTSSAERRLRDLEG